MFFCVYFKVVGAFHVTKNVFLKYVVLYYQCRSQIDLTSSMLDQTAILVYKQNPTSNRFPTTSRSFEIDMFQACLVLRSEMIAILKVNITLNVQSAFMLSSKTLFHVLPAKIFPCHSCWLRHT